LKIAQILPEFHEGGVERHVLWLSNELAAMGHQVTVITAGGKLEDKLDPSVKFWRLPVHRKDPLMGFYSALKIAARAKGEGWDILHAHSRVPVWIAWWASSMSDIPWVFTAHDRYRKDWAIRPFKRAHGSICGSEAVRSHLSGSLPAKTVVIINGIPFSGRKCSKRETRVTKLLFLGRLTDRKGLQVVIQALSGIREQEWRLDIVGDGPKREDLEALAASLGLEGRVFFHGFQDNPEEWMAESELLLFPSLDEGMGLVLMQAIRVGIPVLASDIGPVRELVGESAPLVTPGDVGKWRQGIEDILSGRIGPPRFDPGVVPSIPDMAAGVLSFYEDVTRQR